MDKVHFSSPLPLFLAFIVIFFSHYALKFCLDQAKLLQYFLNQTTEFISPFSLVDIVIIAYCWRFESSPADFLGIVTHKTIKDLYVYIFSFGEYNSKQVNVSGITIFREQFESLKWKCWMPLTFTCSELCSPNTNIYTGLMK